MQKANTKRAFACLFQTHNDLRSTEGYYSIRETLWLVCQQYCINVSNRTPEYALSMAIISVATHSDFHNE